MVAFGWPCAFWLSMLMHEHEHNNLEDIKTFDVGMSYLSSGMKSDDIVHNSVWWVLETLDSATRSTEHRRVLGASSFLLEQLTRNFILQVYSCWKGVSWVHNCCCCPILCSYLFDQRWSFLTNVKPFGMILIKNVAWLLLAHWSILHGFKMRYFCLRVRISLSLCC